MLVAGCAEHARVALSSRRQLAQRRQRRRLVAGRVRQHAGVEWRRGAGVVVQLEAVELRGVQQIGCLHIRHAVLTHAAQPRTGRICSCARAPVHAAAVEHSQRRLRLLAEALYIRTCRRKVQPHPRVNQRAHINRQVVALKQALHVLQVRHRAARASAAPSEQDARRGGAWKTHAQLVFRNELRKSCGKDALSSEREAPCGLRRAHVTHPSLCATRQQ